jgi:hypothetical protein
LEFLFGVVTKGVTTLGVGFLNSCRMALRGFSWLDLEFRVGVATTGVAMLCVGLPVSSGVASLGSSVLLGILVWVLGVSVGVATISVSTLGVGLPASCHMASLGCVLHEKWNLVPESRRSVLRLSASLCQHCVVSRP